MTQPRRAARVTGGAMSGPAPGAWRALTRAGVIQAVGARTGATRAAPPRSSHVTVSGAVVLPLACGHCGSAAATTQAPRRSATSLARCAALFAPPHGVLAAAPCGPATTGVVTTAWRGTRIATAAHVPSNRLHILVASTSGQTGAAGAGADAGASADADAVAATLKLAIAATDGRRYIVEAATLRPDPPSASRGSRSRGAPLLADLTDSAWPRHAAALLLVSSRDAPSGGGDGGAIVPAAVEILIRDYVTGGGRVIAAGGDALAAAAAVCGPAAAKGVSAASSGAGAGGSLLEVSSGAWTPVVRNGDGDVVAAARSLGSGGVAVCTALPPVPDGDDDGDGASAVELMRTVFAALGIDGAAASPLSDAAATTAPSSGDVDTSGGVTVAHLVTDSEEIRTAFLDNVRSAGTRAADADRAALLHAVSPSPELASMEVAVCRGRDGADAPAMAFAFSNDGATAAAVPFPAGTTVSEALLPVDVWPTGTISATSTSATAAIARDLDSRCRLFDWPAYTASLRSRRLGRTVLYADIVGSTQTMLDRNAPFVGAIPDDAGLVVIGGVQVSGRGRKSNRWLSPRGGMSVTAHIRTPIFSGIGCLQYLCALAVVDGVRAIPGGYDALDLRIKWPNDIYFGRDLKLGGVLVTSSVGTHVPGRPPMMDVFAGCGVNVDNALPTVSLNQVIAAHNADTRAPRGLAPLAPLAVETVVGRYLTELEALVDAVTRRGFSAVEDRYYARWLHGGARVTLADRGGVVVTVRGIDADTAEMVAVDEATGEVHQLQPGESSFDMTSNMISRKKAAR